MDQTVKNQMIQFNKKKKITKKSLYKNLKNQINKINQKLYFSEKSKII